MYGMVNAAIRGFVLKNFDQKTWTTIHTKAGTDEDFVAMQSYDDDITYDLVGAASETLDIPAEKILHTFGHYWVTDIATESYREIMSKTGKGVSDFVKNLDHLHERIRVNFPDYQPPSFRVKELETDLLQVDYYSHREGLLPFVDGLLEGLAHHFNEKMSIEHLPDDSHPMPCKRMILTLGSAG